MQIFWLMAPMSTGIGLYKLWLSLLGSLFWLLTMKNDLQYFISFYNFNTHIYSEQSIDHVISFQANCAYFSLLFMSPPQFGQYFFMILSCSAIQAGRLTQISFWPTTASQIFFIYNLDGDLIDVPRLQTQETIAQNVQGYETYKPGSHFLVISIVLGKVFVLNTLIAVQKEISINFISSSLFLIYLLAIQPFRPTNFFNMPIQRPDNLSPQSETRVFYVAKPKSYPMPMVAPELKPGQITPLYFFQYKALLLISASMIILRPYQEGESLYILRTQKVFDNQQYIQYSIIYYS